MEQADMEVGMAVQFMVEMGVGGGIGSPHPSQDHFCFLMRSLVRSAALNVMEVPSLTLAPCLDLRKSRG